MATPQRKFVPPRQNLVHEVEGYSHGIENEVLDRIKRDVERRLSAGALEVPALPLVAEKILRVSNDPAAGMQEIQRIVEGDPFLAGKLLSLVNSAYYAGRQRVTSLRQALVLLGLKTLQDIVFSLSLHQKVFTAKRYMEILQENWQHSIAAAAACGLVAQHLRVEKEDAFLCGLLHDIGRPVLLQSIAQIEDTTLGGREIGAESASVILDDLHETIGAHVAERWRLAANVIDAVRHHHDPAGSREHRTLASIVYCGDRMARHLGIGGEPRECDFRLDRVFNDLKLVDEDVLTRILRDARAQAGSLLDAFRP